MRAKLSAAHLGDRRRDWMTAAGLGTAAAFAFADAAIDIPPLADDLWMLRTTFPELSIQILQQYGWASRPLGIVLVDGVGALVGRSDTLLVLAVLLIHAVAVALSYLVLRRIWRFEYTPAVVATALFAFTPPPIEAWLMLCTIHLSISVPLVLGATGQFVSLALEERECVRRTNRPIVLAALLALVAYAVYDIAILAVPAFVWTFTVISRGPTYLRRPWPLKVVGAAAIASGLWVALAALTGSVDAQLGMRSPESSPIEAQDFSASAHALWIGFGLHHVWRVAEIVRLQGMPTWDRSLLGVVGVLAAAAVAGVVLKFAGPRPSLGPEGSSAGILGNSHDNRTFAAVIISAVVAAYLSVLVFALAHEDFAIVSRIYYFPGMFIGIVMAVAAERLRSAFPRPVAIALAAFVLWSAALTRRYLDDMRNGASDLRRVANALATLSASVPNRGALVIAPGATGTFTTASVQTNSVRGAVERFGNRAFEGPLYFAADCAVQGRAIDAIDERGNPVSDAPWGAVVRLRASDVLVGSALTDVCS